MRELFRIDLKDYDENYKLYVRPSARAIIICEGKVGMIYSNKYDYYKFPGGGIENNEDKLTALKREVLEETGLSVIDDSVSEYGSVLRKQKSLYAENTLFEQVNYYYFCRTYYNIAVQSLDKYESEEGFELQYVLPEYAINVNRTHEHKGYDEMLMERESRVLELLIKEKYL